MILICNREPCCMHSCSKEKCYFILYSVSANLAALILVSKINVTLCYIYCVTANLAALILVPSEPDFVRMENSDSSGAASKFQIDY